MNFNKPFFVFAASLFILFSTVAGYKFAQAFMQGEYSVRFKSPAAISSKVLNEKTADISYAIHSLTQFFKSSSSVEEDEFNGFSTLIFRQFKHISAVLSFEYKNSQDGYGAKIIYFEKSFDYAYLNEKNIADVFIEHARNIGLHSADVVASAITPLNHPHGVFSVVIERIPGTTTFIVLVVDVRSILETVLLNPITNQFALFEVKGDQQKLGYSPLVSFSSRKSSFVSHLGFFNNNWKLEILNPFEGESVIYYLIPTSAFVVSAFIVILVMFIMRMKTLNDQREAAIHELEFAQEKLVEAEKLNAMGGLVAGISHEVNTPLGIGITSISHLQELLNDLNADFKNGILDSNKFEDFVEASQDLVQMAMSNMERASKLVAAFKRVDVINADFSKEAELINVKEFIEQFIQTYQIECGGEKIKFHLSVSDDLKVFSYSSVLSQLLTYLSTNTLVHGLVPGANYCDVYITVGPYKDDGRIWMKFEDKGVGVDEDNLKKIFEPFYTTKRGAGNAGLGLSVVYNLVKSKLKSDLFYGSEVHQGLWIEFELKNL